MTLRLHPAAPEAPEAPDAPVQTGCTVYLARLGDLQDHHLALLDPRETERRSRFTVKEDRDRFTLGAVLLRLAAARSAGCRAAAVRITRTCGRCGRQHGRPQLPGSGVFASVSHSSDLVVVATTAAGQVGVDVERIGGLPVVGVRSSVCTPAERTFLMTARDFFTYWVRKEAILKATGDGLDRDMNDVHVTDPDTLPSLLSIGEETPPCSMAPVSVDGYAGAVAVLSSHRIGFTFVDAGVSLLGA